jgi:N-acetylglutamate synthase
MTIADYNAVVALIRATEGTTSRNADSREALEEFLAKSPGLCFVAKSGSHLVGCVMCGHDGTRSFLHRLAVDPGYKRYGVGSKLVDRCVETLKKRGAEKSRFDVRGAA